MLGTHTELPVRASLMAQALSWCGAEAQDPSFDAGKEQGSPAKLVETQPVETPGGKPQDEARRGASLHPAPSLAELSEQVPSRSSRRASHHPCHARPGSETLARTELRQPVPLQRGHAALPSP